MTWRAMCVWPHISVVLTLAVNGTTTAGLLQILGLTRPEVNVQIAVRKARRHIREQCLAVGQHRTVGS
jgi:1-aminocyclopropane-1-carboxylate deaminase/D-cysteine desulfhydrase-like pyridoxal-dependent ACC family enzyme